MRAESIEILQIQLLFHMIDQAEAILRTFPNTTAIHTSRDGCNLRLICYYKTSNAGGGWSGDLGTPARTEPQDLAIWDCPRGQ